MAMRPSKLAAARARPVPPVTTRLCAGDCIVPTQRIEVLDIDMEYIEKDFLHLTSRALRFIEVAFGIQWKVMPWTKLPVYSDLNKAILAAQGKRTRLHKRVDTARKPLAKEQILHIEVRGSIFCIYAPRKDSVHLEATAPNIKWLLEQVRADLDAAQASDVPLDVAPRKRPREDNDDVEDEASEHLEDLRDLAGEKAGVSWAKSVNAFLVWGAGGSKRKRRFAAPRMRKDASNASAAVSGAARAARRYILSLRGEADDALLQQTSDALLEKTSSSHLDEGTSDAEADAGVASGAEGEAAAGSASDESVE